MVAVVCFVACSFATKRVLCQLESQFQGFEQPELANLKGPHCSPVCQPFWPPSQNVASSPPTFGSGSPSISMPQESRPTFRLERWLNLFGRRPLAQVETLPILSPSPPPLLHYSRQLYQFVAFVCAHQQARIARALFCAKGPKLMAPKFTFLTVGFGWKGARGGQLRYKGQFSPAPPAPPTRCLDDTWAERVDGWFPSASGMGPSMAHCYHPKLVTLALC